MIYKTSGVCAKEIEFEVVEDKVVNVKFIKGCNGSLKAISSLIEGMRVKEAINKLTGIKCGENETSCPDQLAKALSEL